MQLAPVVETAEEAFEKKRLRLEQSCVFARLGPRPYVWLYFMKLKCLAACWMMYDGMCSWDTVGPAARHL